MQEEKPLKNVALSFICNEDWDKMHPTANGRHCNVCNKVVVDFTGKNQSDFEQAMAEANGKLCGRFRAKQTIHLPEFRFDKAAAILMATAGLSIAANNVNAQVKVGKIKMPPKTQQETLKGNAVEPINKEPLINGGVKPIEVRGEVAPPPQPKDSTKKVSSNWINTNPKPWNEQIFLGDTVGPMPPEPVDSSTIDTTGQVIPHSIPPTINELNMLGGPKVNNEKLMGKPTVAPPDTTRVAVNDGSGYNVRLREATYPGGEGAMQKAIAYNLRWPVKLDRELTLNVQVSIDEEGMVTDAFVIKPYRPDVDAEALRVARLLVFTPTIGSDGKPMPWVLVIPINFNQK